MRSGEYTIGIVAIGKAICTFWISLDILIFARCSVKDRTVRKDKLSIERRMKDSFIHGGKIYLKDFLNKIEFFIKIT